MEIARRVPQPNVAYTTTKNDNMKNPRVRLQVRTAKDWARHTRRGLLRTEPGRPA